MLSKLFPLLERLVIAIEKIAERMPEPKRWAPLPYEDPNPPRPVSALGEPGGRNNAPAAAGVPMS